MIWTKKQVVKKSNDKNSASYDELELVLGNGPGYNNTWLDQKQQVRNRYINAITIVANESIASWASEKISTSFSIEQDRWNPQWVVDNGVAICPKTATYLITWYSIIDTMPWSDPTTVYWLLTRVLHVPSSTYIWYGNDVVKKWICVHSVSWIYTIKKWEWIELYGDNQYTWSLDWSSRITLTEISY